MQDVIRLPDVAMQKGFRPIDWVGVTEVPMKSIDPEGVAVSDLLVPLNDQRGTHMSRLIAFLESRQPFNVWGALNNAYEDLCECMRESTKAWWRVEVTHIDEVMGARMPVKITFDATIDERIEQFVGVQFTYSVVCPCSAEMIRHEEREVGNAWAHMQRARLDCIVELDWRKWRELVRMLIVSLPEIPQTYVKRHQELQWCRNMRDMEWFVEDSARHFADVVEAIAERYVVKCTHFETLHPFNVTAVVKQGMP